MVPLMAAVRDALHAGGVPAANLSFNPRPDGQHAEWFWRREFEAGFRWLYAATAPPTNGRKHRGGLGFERYPGPEAHR